MKINKNATIFLAGHNGLVGSAIFRLLKLRGFKKIIIAKKKDLDLRDQRKVKTFFKKKKPQYVILSAAKVGGIKANDEYSAEFIYDNLQIQNNVIHESFLHGVKSLIFLGSSCIYPKFCKQPIKENYLLSSALEKTNEAYSIAKISGLKLCEFYNKQYNTNFKSLMPCNTFGPNDNYDLNRSHFLPALIRKVYEAKLFKKNTIEIWGNGKVLREVIYVDDLADAVIYFLFKKTDHMLINVGSQNEMSIEDYAKMIIKQFGVKLEIKYINKSLVGTPRKILDTSLAKKLGWSCKIPIKTGIKRTISDFKKKYLKYANG